MARQVALYGAVGGVLIALLKFIEYKYLVHEYSSEIYGVLIAVSSPSSAVQNDVADHATCAASPRDSATRRKLHSDRNTSATISYERSRAAWS
jgi:hypothetical protein